MNGTMSDHPPFGECSKCNGKVLEPIRPLHKHLHIRCSSCGAVARHSLPDLDKKVIYLDQFAWSELFNIYTGERCSRDHGDFFRSLYNQLENLVRLQQVVLPHSNIHLDESAVGRNSIGLIKFIERFGGDIQFVKSTKIDLNQVVDAAVSYFNGGPVVTEFPIDDALETPRNVWLPLWHVTIERDYSEISDLIRDERDRLFAKVEKLREKWSQQRFAEVLLYELNGSVTAKINAFSAAIRQQSDRDPLLEYAGHNAPIIDEVHYLESEMLANRIPRSVWLEKISEFWGSEHYKSLPHHRLSSYLFAALSRKATLKANRIFNRGMMNDVRVISSYAPYVHAMMIDQASEALLQQKELKAALRYRAEIFSLRTKESFLRYLKNIEEQTPESVREYSNIIYGEPED